MTHGLPRTFWVLWAGLLVNRAGSFVVPFLAVYLTESLGYTFSAAGVVVASYGAGAMVASPLGGALADHVGRRATMLLALVAGGLGVITLGFVHELRVLVPLCFVVAMLGEAYRPAMQAAVADLVPAHDRVRAFSLTYWVINLGFSIGLLLGGALATHAFLLLFIGDGLTSLAFAAIIWRAVPETRPAPASRPGGPRPAGMVGALLAPYRDRAFAWFILLSVAIFLVFMQHNAALPLDMSARGVSRAWLGFVLGLNGMLIVIVQPFLAPLLARLNRSRVLALGTALVGIGFGLGAFAHGPLGFSVSVAVWTLGEIAVLPIGNAVVADIATADMRGRYQGAYGLCFGLAAFGAPLIGSSVLQAFGARALWGGACAVGLLVAAGHLALEPRLTRLREQRLAARDPVGAQ